MIPNAPSNLIAAVSSSPLAVLLAWTDNTDGTARFVIDRKTGDADWVTEYSATQAGITGFADSSVAASTTYTYRVSACSSIEAGVPQDQSATSNEATVTTPQSDVAASEMVTLIKSALKKYPVGVVTVVVDGQTVSYSRGQAIEELRFWQQLAAAELGLRPRVSRIRLDTQ